MSCSDIQINWQAVSAIGSILAALATLLAVMVALWQTKYASRKKLKLSFSDKMLLLDGQKKTDKFASLTIINVGNRKIIIDSWNIEGNGNNALIIPNSIYGGKTNTFPIEIECEQRILVRWDIDKLIIFLNSFVIKGSISQHRRLKMFVTDTSGKKYTLKSRSTVKKILSDNKEIIHE